MAVAMIAWKQQRFTQYLSKAAGFAALVAIAAALVVQTGPGKAQDKSEGWSAVAPGLVEPRSGEIRIFAPVVGRISEVPVAVNDKVLADEPLVRLDDEEARARVAAQRAEAAMREKERNEKSAGKAANRRKAEDAVADAEEALDDARAAFDNAAISKRAGKGSDATVSNARAAWTSTQENLLYRREELQHVENESETPLPTQLEGQLEMARSNLRASIAELQKLVVRAPIASTVLQVNAKLGELAAPSSAQPLILLGDLSKLRVRAELDEQDVGKIKQGDKAVVRAGAFPGRDFSGTAATIAPIVVPGRISAPGSRNLTDVSVTEVVVDLDDAGPLLPGMKVDVYFQPGGATAQK
ncbi:MAG: efflux RND transporter periplasmic adaptor subunit [Xanthobacteraceae bacterium]